jgi:hypothetical protein
MKIKRPRISNKDEITSSQEEQLIEPIKIMEAMERGGRVYLRVATFIFK